MYRIKKVIGNNFVCARDESGNEVILRGLSIGFRKRPGDLVPPSQIEKIYELQDEAAKNKLMELVANVPLEQVQTCTEIIERAQRTLGKALSENLYITLTDHINFAIERKEKGLEYKNALLWEIQNFYPSEYQLGVQALEQIQSKLGVALSNDEAGFIALHIVNAELDTQMSDMYKITEMIQAVLRIVRNYYRITLDESSLNYGRLIVHLKFLGQRIARNTKLGTEDEELDASIREQFPQAYSCAQRVQVYIENKFQHRLSDDEMTFLTIHIHRVAR